MSFSRGALFACAAGLIALIVMVRRREQLWAVVRAICFGGLAAVAAAPFEERDGADREHLDAGTPGRDRARTARRDPAAAALAQNLLARRESGGALRLPRRSPLIATAVIVAGLALAIVVGAHETSGTTTPRLSGGATRLASLRSDRYDYWSVALRAFGTEPLRGVGAAGWQVYWLRWRTIPEGARDAHSLELQTLAELGLVGFALLLVFIGRGRARRRARTAIGDTARGGGGGARRLPGPLPARLGLADARAHARRDPARREGAGGRPGPTALRRSAAPRGGRSRPRTRRPRRRAAARPRAAPGLRARPIRATA